MEKTLYILSSKSGKTEFEVNEKDLIKLYNNDENVHIVKTSYQNHAKDEAIEFIKKYKNMEKNIIVAGGDGSLNEIANVIYEYDKDKTSLGLIPMGTGNDFSKNFSYKNFNLNKLLSFEKRKIDLIKVNDKVCINVLSMGFDTVVLENAYGFLDKNPKLGKKAYLYGVIKSLPKLSYNHYNFKLYDENKELEFSDDFLLTAICNGGYYGSGFNPAPDAKIDDGILNLVYAKKLPSLLLPYLIIKYKHGKLKNSKYLKEIELKKGSISSDKEILANIDGEIFKAKKIDFEIINKAINWIYFN